VPFSTDNQAKQTMYKTGQKVKVRLSDGKVKDAVIQEYVPDLYTHTHTHTWSPS